MIAMVSAIPSVIIANPALHPPNPAWRVSVHCKGKRSLSHPAARVPRPCGRNPQRRAVPGLPVERDVDDCLVP
jgi:hypothetical protein